MQTDLDDFRKRQLDVMSEARLRECVAWGVVNAPNSEETAYARRILGQRKAKIDEQVQT